MKKIPLRFVALVCILVSMTGCTILENVTPVPTGTAIGKVYVHSDEKLHMQGLIPEVVAQLRSLGYDAESFTGELPKGAVHHLEVTANWRWDMAMYLFYFQATLYEESRVLGVAEYDARKGGGNMGKFGPTAEKIRPLLAGLLKNSKKVAVAAPVVGSAAN